MIFNIVSIDKFVLIQCTLVCYNISNDKVRFHQNCVLHNCYTLFVHNFVTARTKITPLADHVPTGQKCIRVYMYTPRVLYAHTCSQICAHFSQMLAYNLLLFACPFPRAHTFVQYSVQHSAALCCTPVESHLFMYYTKA